MNTSFDYVAGFMFDAYKKRVALIRKNKPAWQRGKLNGIGGKIEPGETAIAAMVREFKEETGFETSAEQWTPFARIFEEGKTPWSVSFFATVGDVEKLRSEEAEKVELFSVNVVQLVEPMMIENLPWLIAMAIDVLEDGRPTFAEVRYGLK